MTPRSERIFLASLILLVSIVVGIDQFIAADETVRFIAGILIGLAIALSAIYIVNAAMNFGEPQEEQEDVEVSSERRV